MKLFFEICKEFFDLLYLPFLSDIIENEILSNEELHEEKGYKEVSDIEEQENQYHDETQDYEYIQNNDQDNHHQLIPDIQYNPEKKDIEESIEDNDDKEICECEFFRQTLSIINARIYKFINDNKNE